MGYLLFLLFSWMVSGFGIPFLLIRHFCPAKTLSRCDWAGKKIELERKTQYDGSIAKHCGRRSGIESDTGFRRGLEMSEGRIRFTGACCAGCNRAARGRS